jgi:hypothetical protein
MDAVIKKGARTAGGIDSYGAPAYAVVQYAAPPEEEEKAPMDWPKWALLGGGLWLMYKSGKDSVPMRSNPYGSPLMVFGILAGGLLAGKTITSVGNLFSGYSGTGLGLGALLGGVYGMKKDQKGKDLLATVAVSALMGLGAGFAYEASMQDDDTGGALTKAWNVIV